MLEANLIVSTTDDLFGSDSRRRIEPRFLGDFRPTNVPLSRFEIEMDEARDVSHRGWAPRTLANIGELTPIPEPRPEGADPIRLH
jgi:hypothetical protein